MSDLKGKSKLANPWLVTIVGGCIAAFVGGYLLIVSQKLGMKEPDFDGAYVQVIDDSYIQLNEVENFTTAIITAGKTDVFDLTRMPNHYYVTSIESAKKIPKSKFKGIYMLGEYDLKSLSIHPLEEKSLTKNQGFFENRGPARKGTPFFEPGKQFNLKKKKDPERQGYFYELTQKLDKGIYVVWIGRKFWLFTLE